MNTFKQRCVLFYIDAAVQCRSGDPHDEHLPCEELPWRNRPQQRHGLTDPERHETHHHCWRRSRQLQEDSVWMFRHMGLITCSISNTVLCMTSLLLTMLICLYVLQFNCGIKYGWLNSNCSKVKQSGTQFAVDQSDLKSSWNEKWLLPVLITSTVKLFTYSTTVCQYKDKYSISSYF